MSKDTILFLSACPSGYSPIKINEEFSLISKVLNGSRKFDVKFHSDLEKRSLHSILAQYRPTIVHFSGHGLKSLGLVVNGISNRNSEYMNPEYLKNAFGIFEDIPRVNIQCALLNTCYSEEQAKAIAEHIDYVIGSSGKLIDEDAVLFSSTFYERLEQEYSIKEAYFMSKKRLKNMENNSTKIGLFNTYEDSMKTRGSIKKEQEDINQMIKLVEKEQVLLELQMKAIAEKLSKEDYKALASWIQENKQKLSLNVSQEMFFRKGITNKTMLEDFAILLKALINILHGNLLFGDMEKLDEHGVPIKFDISFYKEALYLIPEFIPSSIDCKSVEFLKALIKRLVYYIQQE